MGMGNPAVALVDVALVANRLGPASSMGGFAARNGISVRDGTKAVATHETGHVAGCRGDRVIFEDAPAVTVRSRFAPVAGRCEAWLEDDGPWTCLALQAEGIPPALFRLHGPSAVTMGDLVAEVNASAAFRAEVVSGWDGADAARLAHTNRATAFNLPAGAVLPLRPHALVNGVMSYNHFNPARWKAPAFDNAAATNAAGPLRRLYEIEVGSADVVRIGGDDHEGSKVAVRSGVGVVGVVRRGCVGDLDAGGGAGVASPGGPGRRRALPGLAPGGRARGGDRGSNERPLHGGAVALRTALGQAGTGGGHLQQPDRVGVRGGEHGQPLRRGRRAVLRPVRDRA
jgi:hypothetical protein